MVRTSTRVAGPVGADLLDFSRFQESQEQPLHAQGHFPDFIHEDRAVVGDLELAGLVTERAGEAAAHVAEQLRFEERFGQARAVHFDERAVRPLALRPQLARDYFLTGATLAGDQDLRVRHRDALNFFPELFDRRAVAKQLCCSVESH